MFQTDPGQDPFLFQYAGTLASQKHATRVLASSSQNQHCITADVLQTIVKQLPFPFPIAPSKTTELTATCTYITVLCASP